MQNYQTSSPQYQSYNPQYQGYTYNLDNPNVSAAVRGGYAGLPASDYYAPGYHPTQQQFQSDNQMFGNNYDGQGQRSGIGSMFGGGGIGAAFNGIGGILSGLGGIFGGGGRNPSDAGMPYLKQIEGKLQGYYSPYTGAGQRALQRLEPEYNKLLDDPTSIMNKIGGQFHSSPGYQYNVNEATRGANQAAAAGGMLGSPAEQAELAKSVSGIANQDYYNFLDRGLGLYGQGLGGLSHINDMGFQATSDIANNVAQSLNNQAQMAYAGQANQNQMGGGWLSGLGGVMSGIGSLSQLF